MSATTVQRDGVGSSLPAKAATRMIKVKGGYLERVLVDSDTAQVTHVVIEDPHNVAAVRLVQEALGLTSTGLATCSQPVQWVDNGAEIFTSEGWLGRVDSFLVDITDGTITHIVLYEEHLVGKNLVPVPCTAIARAAPREVYLKVSAGQVDAWPSIPARDWS